MKKTKCTEYVAFEIDAMGIVYDAVDDRVRDGGFADHLMPARDGQLRGDDG